MEHRAYDHRPVFVVGMPRSGTTLLMLLLSAHPRIAVLPETQFLCLWRWMYRFLDDRRPREFELFWQTYVGGRHFRALGLDAGEIRSRMLEQGDPSFRTMLTVIGEAYAAQKGKPRWGEKSPTHFKYLDTIFSWYPNAQIIYLLRDPRAVIASIFATPWGHPSVYRNCMDWLESLEIYEKNCHDTRIRLIRYETLVTQAEQELRVLCDWLGEVFISEMMEHTEHASCKDFQPCHGAWGEQHKASALRPVSQESLEKWRTHLSASQIAIIEHLTRDAMLRYGYAPVHSSLSGKQRCHLVGSRLFAKPGTLRSIFGHLVVHYHLKQLVLTWCFSRWGRMIDFLVRR